MIIVSTDRRIVLVTGATRGLGRAMVDRLVETGHIVIGCGRDRKRIEAMRVRYPEPHRFDTLDVASDCQVAEWAESVLTAGQIPDLILNNAAVMNDPKPLWETTAQEMEQLLDVNIGGTVNIIRHFVPAMLPRKTGVIVNFSSGWGRSTAPEVAPYCATKFAIEGLTQSLSQELPWGMAAVALNPGVIDTDMLRQCWADGASHYPNAERWSRTAVPFLLQLSAKDNGESVTAPI